MPHSSRGSCGQGAAGTSLGTLPVARQEREDSKMELLVEAQAGLNIISIFRGRLWHRERVTQIGHGTRWGQHRQGTAVCRQGPGRQYWVFPCPVPIPFAAWLCPARRGRWVGAGNQIGISESCGSVLTVRLLLTVMVGHRGVPLRN